VAQFPCTKPGHDGLTIFIFQDSDDGQPNAEQQAQIDSLRACERCKDKDLVFIMHFGKPLKPVPIDVTPQARHEPAPVNFITFNIGDDGGKPEP
jgi:tagatose-1,6-bisphosphate aldolase